jgi:hypothetical protein
MNKNIIHQKIGKNHRRIWPIRCQVQSLKYYLPQYKETNANYRINYKKSIIPLKTMSRGLSYDNRHVKTTRNHALYIYDWTTP